MTNFDVGIIGLGAMGSASAHALARRGARVVGFDQFCPPHSAGSSHGHTRIIREAYYEHPLYVPLVQRCYDLWRKLERETGDTLLAQTGGVMVGPESGALVKGALASVTAHNIPHDLLDAAAVAERFPAYRPHADWVAVFEHRAGMLFPERCVRALLSGAQTCGADIHLEESVRRWGQNGNRITVETMAGEYDVDRLVIAAGPWLPNLLASYAIALPLEIERQLSHWFEPSIPGDRYSAARCPIGLWEPRENEFFATLPDEGHGVKCGMHHAGAPTSPDSVDRGVSDEENEAARRLLDDVMPGAGGKLRESRVCLYTNTPDHHFIIDWLEGARVLIVSPCSGHGFKFASGIGEIVAQLVQEGRSWLDLEPFKLSRFR